MRTKAERTDQDRPEGAGGRVVVVLVLVLTLMVGTGYAAAYYFATDRVPRGAEVDGVAVGGLERAEAEATLREGLAERERTPITVTAGDQTQEVRPREAGLSLDVEAAIEEAGAGSSWAPSRLWDYYTGGDDDLETPVEIDQSRMSRVVTDLAAGFGAEARNGSIRFVGDRPIGVAPRSGEGLDPDATEDALVAAYTTGETAALEFTEVSPEIGEEQVAEALETQAEPAVAGPVTLGFGDDAVELTPRQFAPALRFVEVDGGLSLEVAPVRLARVVAAARGDAAAADAPVDATIDIVDGRPQVVPGRPGRSYDRVALVEAMEKALSRPRARRADVDASLTRPEVTGRQVRGLGVRERVSEFTTSFPYAEYRNVNIGRAARLVDGTLLRPGDVFSMNDIVGERTRANGFTEGTVISDGVFKEDLGGGVSQMATTTFNAMFFAGLEDVEHKPHSFYISRYPVGREATLAFPVLDLRFRNDTRHGVLVKSRVVPSTPSSEGSVTVSMWSTKTWDIESQTSERYNPTSPDTRRLSGPGCIPNSGFSGFTVDVTRVFRRADQDRVVRRENFNTVYTPSDTVICT